MHARAGRRSAPPWTTAAPGPLPLAASARAPPLTLTSLVNLLGFRRMTLGLVCGACESLSPIQAGTCVACGASLGIGGGPRQAAQTVAAPPQDAPLPPPSIPTQI